MFEKWKFWIKGARIVKDLHYKAEITGVYFDSSDNLWIEFIGHSYEGYTVAPIEVLIELGWRVEIVMDEAEDLRSRIEAAIRSAPGSDAPIGMAEEMRATAKEKAEEIMKILQDRGAR